MIPESTNSSPTYLIPCECGAVIPATADQSSVELLCSACGQKTLIPSLSELRQLPVRDEAAVRGGLHVQEIRPWLALWIGIWMFWAIGLGANSLLAWHAFRPIVGLPGCSVDTLGCDLVLASHYGRVLGLSVTIYAFLFYLAVAWTLIVVRKLAAPFSLILPAVTATGVTAGGWSLWVMVVHIERTCPWCLGVHIANLMLFLLSLIYAWRDWRQNQSSRHDLGLPPLPSRLVSVAAAATVALSLFSLLLFSQFHGQPKVRLVPIAEPLFDELVIDESSDITTIKGETAAPNRLVVYTCFTCPGCRRLNALLSAMLFEYSGQLRVDMRFSPRQANCNRQLAKEADHDDNVIACDLAKAAVALAKVDTGAFESYNNWLYAIQKDLTVKSAWDEARRRVDPDRFDEALNSADVTSRLEQDESLAERTGAKSVPQIYLRAGRLEGDMLFSVIRNLIERRFGLKTQS